MNKSTAVFLKFSSITLIAAAIFIGDLYTPLGIAAGVPYVLVVLLALWFNNERTAIGFAMAGTILTLAGWYLSPDGGEYYKVVLNRFYAITAVWAVGIALYYHMMSRKKLINQKETYEKLSYRYKQQVDTLNSAAIVSIADIEGNITFVNEMFCNISGYSEDELIGQNHRILKSNIHPPGLFVGMWKSISMGNLWQGEICNKAKDGSYYWVYTTIAPFKDKEGHISEYVSVRFDITKIKEYERLLKERNAEMKYANNKLEEANKELEMFSYSISHDLKAPLRALQGFSKNLNEKYSESLDETAKRWIEFINENAKRMDVLIADVLSFSRVSRKEVNMQMVNMNAIVQEIIDLEKANYKQPVVIEVDQLPEALGDTAMVTMIWQNLIGNAFKYSSQKEKIEIRVEGFLNNTHAHYTVKDNGAGFDMRHADKLFGVFQRLHRNDEFEGTGVGLANVNRIVQKHGGTLKAQGEVGKGAIFEFTLPKGDKD